MPTFRSVKDLMKHFNGKSVSDLKGNQGAVGLEKSMTDTLKREAELLASCIQDELDKYYNSYSPIVYRRRAERKPKHPYPLRDGINVEPVQVESFKGGKMFSIAVNFKEENAHHPSIFNGEDGFVPNLLNYGWRWKKKSGPYRLGHYEGAKFVEKGIAQYYKKSRFDFEIRIVVHYKNKKIVDKYFNSSNKIDTD